MAANDGVLLRSLLDPELDVAAAADALLSHCSETTLLGGIGAMMVPACSTATADKMGSPTQNDQLGEADQEHDPAPRDCAEDAVLLPVDVLFVSDSPRVEGEEVEHVRALAESSAVLPPILVHRPTMRVIDGMHRLSAAKRRGETSIRAMFVNGDVNDVFVLAVKQNIAHGLPLSRKDRIKAAERIIETYPDWSDRAVATVAGLSHKTIGSIRCRSAGDSSQPNTRIGRDGRFRPTDRTTRRERAAALVLADPDVTLRQISDMAGISVSTAKQVRDEVRTQATVGAGDNTQTEERDVQPEAPVVRGSEQPLLEGTHTVKEVSWVVNALKNDPSVRHTEAGRALLRLLGVHALNPSEWRNLVDGVPAHCCDVVAQAARSCAESWDFFARQVADKSV